ncbi:hypothetical protein GBAR_LOCUS25273, partial [Geodia barretti]
HSLQVKPHSGRSLRTPVTSVLCIHLSIPDDKRDVDSAVEYYVQSTDPMKMRRMIFCLDRIGDTVLADSLMEYAEPPADPSLNPHLLIPVFTAISGDWGRLLATLQYQMPGLLSSVRSSEIVIKSLLRLGSTTLSIIMIPAGKTYPSSLCSRRNKGCGDCQTSRTDCD